MVSTSYWPPLVAISVVTFWRSWFSSIVTQTRSIPGFFALKSSVSFCIRIMSPLLTVAMVSLVAVCAKLGSARVDSAMAEHAPIKNEAIFIAFLPKLDLSFLYLCEQIFTNLLKSQAFTRPRSRPRVEASAGGAPHRADRADHAPPELMPRGLPLAGSIY